MTKKQKKVLLRIILSIVLTIIICIANVYVIKDMPFLSFCMFLVPYIIIGYDVLKKAFRGILQKQVFDENFLMCIATVGAFALNEATEAVAVMIFYQIGELFQSIAVSKSRKNIASLMDIRPDFAHVLTDDGEKTVSPQDVATGSTIIVRAGEKIPLDGVVLSGKSTVDTSSLTGETLAKEVYEGMTVLSGCINGSGMLKICTTTNFAESTVQKILRLVEDASLKKASAERFITKFAKVYTPLVCILSLILALAVPLLIVLYRIISLNLVDFTNVVNLDALITSTGAVVLFKDYLFRALTFLVISCPCALVISIPLTFFAGLGSASKNGILVKGSEYLELLAKMSTLVFDKTGTLTNGSFVVTNVCTANGFTQNDVLRFASYAEENAKHPLKTCVQNAYGKTVQKDAILSLQEFAGKGIKAVLALQNGAQIDSVANGASTDKTIVLVGNSKLLRQENIIMEENALKSANASETALFVAINNVFAGAIFASDTLKSTTKDAIQNLKKCGILDMVLLTGDNAQVGNFIAKSIGIERVKTELLPEDKVKEVEKLLCKNKTLGFVGDGINDAPVLSRADIGIAMGALGSDAAIEAADVVLMDDNPLSIALAIKIARRTVRIVKQNIFLALVIKLLALVLGALGIANMWLAIFADVGAMVLAVCNATRALHTNKRCQHQKSIQI